MKKNYELQVRDVIVAEIKLNPQSVVITMNKNIQVDELQVQLKMLGNYTIKEVI